jgi:putative nucleotidyltransferase with HDIG domain
LVAAQVAMVLDKAQMKSRLKLWQRQLDALNKAAQTLNSVFTLDELVERILDIAVDALDLDRSALLLVNSTGEDLVVEAERGYGADVKGMRIALGEGITGAVASIGEPILVADTARDERYVDSGVNGRCEMAVPLKVQGRIIGVLDSEGAAPGAFDQYDLDLFSAFAAQAATAVHSTRLLGSLEEANHRLEENVTEMVRMNTELTNYSRKVFRINESLESQLKNLTAIHEAGKTITSSLDLDHTLNTILEMTSQIIGSTAGAIKLLDEETNEFRVRAKSGTLTDVSAMSTVFEVPLEIGDKQIGIFQLVLKAQNGVGKGERRMVETLASQAAIAIENARLFESTQQIYYDTLKSLARALEARDDYTRGHSERVADLSKKMAEDLGLESQEVQTIYNAALLHDIGKIGIRDEVLLAPRKLTENEMNIIKDHSAFGNTILMPLKFLSNIRECVRHHHERWDGTGYPDGKKGEEIPLASRIIAVADAYDAMTSNRPYRTSISHPVAVENIKQLSGAQFDPRVVDSFVRVIS